MVSEGYTKTLQEPNSHGVTGMSLSVRAQLIAGAALPWPRHLWAGLSLWEVLRSKNTLHLATCQIGPDSGLLNYVHAAAVILGRNDLRSHEGPQWISTDRSCSMPGPNTHAWITEMAL